MNKLSRECYKKRLSKELIEKLRNDYNNKTSVKALVEKYDRAWSTLCGYIKESGIEPNRHHGTNVYEQSVKQKIKKIDYNKIVNGKTLREWQKYNTEINKKYIRGYNGL